MAAFKSVRYWTIVAFTQMCHFSKEEHYEIEFEYSADGRSHGSGWRLCVCGGYFSEGYNWDQQPGDDERNIHRCDRHNRAISTGGSHGNDRRESRYEYASWSKNRDRSIADEAGSSIRGN